MKLYLDNAATTKIDPLVKEEMTRVMDTVQGNPSSIHSYGREAKTVIEKSRKKIAKIFNASPSEIFFTSGGSESNNTIINGAIRDLKIKTVISSPLEHPSVLNTLLCNQKEKNIDLHFVELNPNGHIDLHSLENLLKKYTCCFVSLMHANNEIGNTLSLKKTGELCEKYGAVFHSDTVQTVGKYEINLQTVNVDFITCSAHKLHGPKGSGFFYTKYMDKMILPFIFGGSQERNMRAGTENIYGIAGMAKALEIAYANLEENKKHIEGLKSCLIKNLKENFSNIVFNGDAENKSLYNIVNAGFDLKNKEVMTPDKQDMLLFNLDIAGIAVSGGSACSSGTNIGSHVLKALKMDEAKISIRFSFSKYNKKEEIDYLIMKLKEILD